MTLDVGAAITSALQVEWHRVGDVRTGEWCWSCSLPSAVEVDMVLVAVRTLRPLRRATVTVCHDCGRAVTT